MKRISLFYVIYFSSICLAQEKNRHQTFIIDDAFKAKYSYIKYRIKNQGKIDFWIVCNSFLISDTQKIRCLLDSINFYNVKKDKFYSRDKSVKKFGISHSIWYIENHSFTTIDPLPIINCLCK